MVRRMDRQTDSQTEMNECLTDRLMGGHTDCQTDRQTNSQTYMRLMGGHTDGQTDRQTNKQVYGQTNGQIDSLDFFQPQMTGR
jgi:hypothetical protein